MPGPGRNPTIAEIYTFASELVDYWDERDKHGNTNSPNAYGLFNDASADSGGEFMGGALGGLREDRAAAGRVLTPDSLQRSYDLIHREALRKYGLPRTGSYEQKLYRLIEAFFDNAQLFKSRNFTFGTPAFVTPFTGNGVIRRCTVDRRGYKLECTGSEAKKAICIRDQTSGARRHREVFRFEGATPSPDALSWLGSGIQGEIATADCLSPGTPLLNPSFEGGVSGTDNTLFASTTQCTSWVADAAATFKSRVETEETSPHALVYKGFEGSPLGTGKLASLEFQASGNIQQIIQRQGRRALSRDVSYYGHLAWRRRASATGTLSFEIGSKSVSVDVSTGTNDIWNLLLWPASGGPGQNSWFDNFVEDLLNVKIAMASLAVGQVAIDDVHVIPMVNIDGTYALPVGGTTPFLVEDTASWTDTENASRARHSYWLWRSLLAASRLQALGGVWLPTTTASTDITIPD